MSEYSNLLEEARRVIKDTAKIYIPILYRLLKEEGKDPPECRKILEHDLGDKLAKATILKFLPEECKDPDKVDAGKKSSEEKERKKEIMITTNGTEDSVRPDPTESGSVGEKEPKSGSFDPDSLPTTDIDHPILKEKPDEGTEAEAQFRKETGQTLQSDDMNTAPEFRVAVFDVDATRKEIERHLSKVKGWHWKVIGVTFRYIS